MIPSLVVWWSRWTAGCLTEFEMVQTWQSQPTRSWWYYLCFPTFFFLNCPSHMLSMVQSVDDPSGWMNCCIFSPTKISRPVGISSSFCEMTIWYSTTVPVWCMEYPQSVMWVRWRLSKPFRQWDVHPGHRALLNGPRTDWPVAGWPKTPVFHHVSEVDGLNLKDRSYTLFIPLLNST